jgi:hypothetical protein
VQHRSCKKQVQWHYDGQNLSDDFLDRTACYAYDLGFLVFFKGSRKGSGFEELATNRYDSHNTVKYEEVNDDDNEKLPDISCICDHKV